MPEETVIRVGAGASTIRGRLLGSRLRARRRAAKLKAVEIAKRMGRSPSTVSKWETGEQVPRPPELLYMLEQYRVKATERDALMRLGEEARRPTEEVVSVAVNDYDWLHARASCLESFNEAVMPDLLQTPAYVREVLKAWDPTAKRDHIEHLLSARLARQKRLRGRDAIDLRVVLSEAALRQQVAGPQATKEQLRHLLDCAALPNVELRILPHEAGAHPGFAGSFAMLHFPDMPTLVYVVTRSGDIYFEDAEPFSSALRRIRAKALPERDSVAMIAAFA